MKGTPVVAASPRFLRATETLVKRKAIIPRLVNNAYARIVLGGRGVVDDCERGKWLKAVKRGKRRTLYRYCDIHLCADRIERGEYPKEQNAEEVRQ